MSNLLQNSPQRGRGGRTYSLAEFQALSTDPTPSTPSPEPTATHKTPSKKERTKALTDPNLLAKSFLSRRRWYYWQEQFWSYEETRYVALSDTAAQDEVWNHVKSEFGVFGPKKGHVMTPALVKSVLFAIRASCRLPDGIEQPVWIESPERGRDFLAFSNGILDVKTGDLLAHSEDWFSPVVLPYEYRADATCPRWLDVLDVACGGDKDKIAVIQEWFGYLLVRTNGAQSFMILFGPGANGKSVICAVGKAMLGAGNVSHVPLDKFRGEYYLTGTLGKLANINSEVERFDDSAEGLLKAYTNGEPSSFRRIYGEAFDAMPTARLMFASNNPPRFSDKTEALWRRLIMVPLTVTIPKDKRDPNLTRADWWEQGGELPGVLNWSREGLRRLEENNWQFTKCNACDVALEEHRQDSNPARRYLSEHYVFDPSTTEGTSSNDLFKHYEAWCKDNGHRQPMNSGNFGKEVVATFGVSPIQKWFPKTRQNLKFYPGLRFLDVRDNAAGLKPHRESGADCG